MPLSIAELARLLPSPVPTAPALPTGIAALDTVLLGGGLPRGRLTEMVGPTGSGKTTLARSIAEQTVTAHGWVAWIDAQRTLDARDWVHLGEAQGMWMIRPRDPSRALWCADVLLRSGAFALLVLDGAPVISKSNAVRLTRLARDGNCVLLVLGDRGGGATQLGGAVRLVVERPAAGSRRRSGAGHRERQAQDDATRTIAVRVEKGGTIRTVEVSCAIGVARRLCTHPEVPDRRGVARGPAGGSRHARAGSGGSGAPSASTAAHPAGRPGTSGDSPRGVRPPTAVVRARSLG